MIVTVALAVSAIVINTHSVQFTNVYHGDTVADIFTDVQYLYVHPHDTLLIHFHAFNANEYVFLAYQHAYVVFAAFAVAAFVAAVQLGFHTLVIFLVLRDHGDVHRFANVRLVHHEIT